MKDVKTNPTGAAYVAINKSNFMEREAVKLGAGGLWVELRCGCWDLVNILALNTCCDLQLLFMVSELTALVQTLVTLPSRL